MSTPHIATQIKKSEFRNSPEKKKKKIFFFKNMDASLCASGSD